MKMVCPSYGAIAVFTVALVLITLKINTLIMSLWKGAYIIHSFEMGLSPFLAVSCPALSGLSGQFSFRLTGEVRCQGEFPCVVSHAFPGYRMLLSVIIIFYTMC